MQRTRLRRGRSEAVAGQKTFASGGLGRTRRAADALVRKGSVGDRQKEQKRTK